MRIRSVLAAAFAVSFAGTAAADWPEKPITYVVSFGAGGNADIVARMNAEVLSEALGVVLLCGGLALWLEVSFLIAAMTMGAMIANLARHHEYPFHAIENIEWPFMVVFFVLAGATLELGALVQVGLFGVVYIVCRALGKYAGAGLGAALARADQDTKRWMGLALLPQAGVAIGMALVASSHLPEHRQTLLSIVIGSTVFFEIIGPVFTRLAVKRTEKA